MAAREAATERARDLVPRSANPRPCVAAGRGYNAASDAALALGRPLDKINETTRVLIDRANTRLGSVLN